MKRVKLPAFENKITVGNIMQAIMVAVAGIGTFAVLVRDVGELSKSFDSLQQGMFEMRKEMREANQQLRKDLNHELDILRATDRDLMLLFARTRPVNTDGKN
jgi:hypothetical protein